MEAGNNYTKASYETDAYTSLVLDKIIEWIKENRSIYRASGEAEKKAFKNLMEIDVFSSHFEVRYETLYKFFEATVKNFLVYNRTDVYTEPGIGSHSVDGYFVFESLSYGKKEYKIPVPLGYYHGIGVDDAYYKEQKERYLDSCYSLYMNQFNKGYESVTEDAKIKKQWVDDHKISKDIGRIMTLIILVSGFYAVFKGITYLIDYIEPFFKADDLKEAFLFGESWYRGIAYVFERARGMNRMSFLSLLTCGIVFLLLLELIVIIFSLKSGISDYRIYCANKNLCRIYKVMERERTLITDLSEAQRRRRDIRRTMKLDIKRAGQNKKGFLKRWLSIVIVFLCIFGLNYIETDAERIYSYERRARDFIDNIKLEASVLCIARNDIPVYEFQDTLGTVRSYIEKGRVYFPVSDTDGDYIRVKYMGKCGYTEGWIFSSYHNLGVPYDYPEYQKQTIEGVSTVSYPEDKPENYPEKMIDGRLNTAWCPAEGKAWYNEKITLTIPEDENGQAREIEVMGIAPGRCLNKAAFEDSSRPERIIVSFYNKSFCRKVTFYLEDGAYFQYYSLNQPVKADKIEIEAEAVVYGNSDNTMYISELSFYGKNKEGQGSVN